MTDRKAAEKFIKAVGYPVFCKPEIGVGATDTFKIENEADLDNFFKLKPDEGYVMEEFVTGVICSYDAISDSQCNILFESMNVWPPVADIVKKKLDLMYYTASDIPEQLRERGRATIKAFGVNQRFVHLEFFRLTKAKKGLGKVGDYIGLDIVLAIMEVIYSETGDSKYAPSPLLRKMVRAGKLGKKTGVGFYDYSK